MLHPRRFTQTSNDPWVRRMAYVEEYVATDFAVDRVMVVAKRDSVALTEVELMLK